MQCIITETEGIRQRGCLKKTQWDYIKEDMKSFGPSREDSQDKDQDRALVCSGRGGEANMRGADQVHFPAMQENLLMGQ